MNKCREPARQRARPQIGGKEQTATIFVKLARQTGSNGAKRPKTIYRTYSARYYQAGDGPSPELGISRQLRLRREPYKATCNVLLCLENSDLRSHMKPTGSDPSDQFVLLRYPGQPTLTKCQAVNKRSRASGGLVHFLACQVVTSLKSREHLQIPHLNISTQQRGLTNGS